MKADLFPGDEKYKKRMEVENAHMDDTCWIGGLANGD